MKFVSKSIVRIIYNFNQQCQKMHSILITELDMQQHLQQDTL